MYQLKVENIDKKKPVYDMAGVSSLIVKCGLPKPVCVSFYVPDGNGDIPTDISLFYHTKLSATQEHKAITAIQKEVFNHRL